MSEYEVQDKKQVAEFDPSAWVEEEEDEEPSRPCPICGSADQEEVSTVISVHDGLRISSSC